MRTARTVGVAMDCSPAGKSAFRWTVKYLNDGDTLILIYVQPKNANPTGQIFFEISGSPSVDLFKQYGLVMDEETRTAISTLSEANKVKVKTNVYWGDPKKTMCDAVEKLRLDSLVVGIVGSLRGLLRGSVSSYVVANATCPVMVVKEPSAVGGLQFPFSLTFGICCCVSLLSLLAMVLY